MSALAISLLTMGGLGAFFRPRELDRIGVSYRDLQSLVEEEAVLKVGPGLYRLAAVEPDEFETIAMVSSAAPGGSDGTEKTQQIAVT